MSPTAQTVLRSEIGEVVYFFNQEKHECNGRNLTPYNSSILKLAIFLYLGKLPAFVIIWMVGGIHTVEYVKMPRLV